MKINGLFCALLAVLLFYGCTKKPASEFNSDPNLYKDFITGFTSGVSSARTDVRVQLAFSKKEWTPNQPLDNSLFDISPSVSGKVVALSSNSVAFIPDKPLKHDTEYQVTFHLSEIIKTPEKLSDFNFTIKTIKQDFIVKADDIQSYDRNTQYLNCRLVTADVMDFSDVSALVSATQNGKKLPVRFDKSLSGGSEFKFVVDSITRYEDDSKLEILYDGSAKRIKQKGKLIFPIIGKNNFAVVDVKVGDENNQSLNINFTDPLLTDQDFTGLVSVESAKSLRYATDGNVLKVFFEEPLTGNLLLEIFQGIQSEERFKLKKTYAERIAFEQMKPNVRFVKSGTILPGSANLKVSFEAVNLSAVDLKVYKIYQSNVLQFLQVNQLEGAQNLKRVAQPVAKRTLKLNSGPLINQGKWNAYAIDLSKYITPDPGAIYRVELAYKKKYSLYKCDTSEADPDFDEPEENEDDVNYSGDYYDDYYYDDYEWRQEQDPCTNSYFYNAKVATNVLATNLGVIAKRGENKSYFFAVNNILTTEPVCAATIDLYSFQQQKLASLKTDSDGVASIKLDKFAYFAVVTERKNTTYVKLDDGTSLSVSNFDVAGEHLQKGLKGFIYGERGVWRPGDDVCLSFILDDNANKLPAGHAVKLRLSDPSGKVVYQTVKKSVRFNHYSFIVPTSPDAPTGNWEAMVSVGGARFYKSVKIETIKPNRLKIRNSLDGQTLSSSRPATASIDVAWLHGAVAKGLKVEIQAKFSQQETKFKGFDRYVFDDAVRKFGSEEVNVFSGKLDASGHATASIDPKLNRESPGMLKAAFITKVYEEGGDFSMDVASATYSPFETYVGLKTPDASRFGTLETRKMNRFDIVTLDSKGNPKPVQNLEVRVYKTEWRWWWDSSADDNLSDYNSATATTAFKTFIINTGSDGKGSVQFSLTDEEWGRYLIRVIDPVGGHATAQTVLIDWPAWSGKTKNTDASSANMLIFSTDKKKYSVGENALLAFPSSEGGRALISIESGSKVVKTYWARTQKGETKVEIPITDAMAPNVYFNITLLQPHAKSLNDSPIRMYGIVPIEVYDKQTVLEPLITMPETLRPEQEFVLKVSEKEKRAMSYTIAIVDEGLLDLTRFKTPNAWNSFYTREALGVKTWDVYDDVIGAYGGKINQIFSIGGDQDLGGGKAKKANRFKPVVKFLGPFELKAGQAQNHKIRLPKYIGSVRAMVVAADADKSAYGSVEKTVAVKSPLMVLASMPRKVSQTERITLPVTIFAMENRVKNVVVKVQASSGLKVSGASSQTITFDRPDEKMAYFDLEAGSASGISKVQITATSGNLKSSYDVEIDLINPNPVTYDFKDVVLGPNETRQLSWHAFGVAGSNTATLEVSSMPAIDLSRRLQYLISYPHGCVEQTTSAVFPQLYLSDVVDLDAKRKQSIQTNVTAGIKRLNGYQLPNGGFVYWPGNKVADDWGTSYAGHFMLEAEKKGYVLPINFKSKWLSYQKNEAKQWRFLPSYQNDLAQAYRLYTLALAGSPDLASMNRLRETVGISNESKLRLAAAYAVAGQKQAGLALLSRSAIDSPAREEYYYFGSPERNRAMALETLLLLGQKQKAFETATKLAKAMASNEWMSTQTSAYSLYAMALFAKMNGGGGLHVGYGSGNIKSEKSIATRTLSVNNGRNAINLKNNGKNTLFVRVLSSGILPVGNEQVMQKNLSASMVYKDRKGSLVNVKSVKQGTEMVATITVRNLANERVDNIALTQILPSGFEIVNTRFTDYGGGNDKGADYIDYRDDRANFYFGLKANETKTFTVVLNASYLGHYYLPGLQCEAMYDHSFIARTKGQWIDVVK